MPLKIIRCGKDKYDRLMAIEIAKCATIKTGELIEPYICRNCHWYHVGHARFGKQIEFQKLTREERNEQAKNEGNSTFPQMA